MNQFAKCTKHFVCGFSDEDILADSSDEDDLQEDILMDTSDQPNERPKKKARRKEEKYIHEDADNIVDLADIKAMSSIACEFSTKKNSVFE